MTLGDVPSSVSVDVSEVPAKRTIADAFNPRKNSLNLMRLVLAITVVASHSIDLGLFGKDWIGNRTTIGEVAVFGFFGISGFLIARSAESNSTGRYLWQRCIRILPAYWVCLIVTACGIAFLGWTHLGHIYHLPVPPSAYFHAPNGPFSYIVNNWFLRIGQFAIVTTVWNGSIWTLFYEFLCYLMLGVLAFAGLLRRKLFVVALFAGIWVAEAACTLNPSWQALAGPSGPNYLRYFLELSAVFLAGTLIYLYRKQIRDSGWIALACTAGCIVSLWLPLGSSFPGLSLTSTSLFAPLLAYPALWISFHLPWTWVGSKNDYSYGIYIYAYPIGVLLGPYGMANHGYLLFFIACMVCTVPLAFASWWLIERPALKLRRWTPGRPDAPISPSAGPTEVSVASASEQNPTEVTPPE